MQNGIGVQELTKGELSALHVLVREHGMAGAARLLGMTRSSLGSLMAGRARHVTIIAYRAQLAALHASEVGP